MQLYMDGLVLVVVVVGVVGGVICDSGETFTCN